MIRGNVNAHREATAPLVLRDNTGNELTVTAVVDTGFNGYLILPPDPVAKLGLLFVFQSSGTLADGSVVSLDVYEVTVVWDGTPRTVEADCIDGPHLVGMALLEGFDLHIHNIAGGDVVIEPIP